MSHAFMVPVFSPVSDTPAARRRNMEHRMTKIPPPCFRHPDPQSVRPDRSFCSRSCCPGFMPSVAGTGKALPPAGNDVFPARSSALRASAFLFPPVPRYQAAEQVPCRRSRNAASARRSSGGGLRCMTFDGGKRPGAPSFRNNRGRNLLRSLPCAAVPLP